MRNDSDLQRDVAAHLSSISFNAIHRLQVEIDKSDLNQARIAEVLERSPGRVSQILNPDKSMTLKQMVRLARVMGLKACVLFYDDKDKDDKYGPLHPDIFEACWIRCGSPTRMGQVADAMSYTNAQMPPNIVEFSKYAASASDGKDTAHARTITTPIQLQGTCGNTGEAI